MERNRWAFKNFEQTEQALKQFYFFCVCNFWERVGVCIGVDFLSMLDYIDNLSFK